MNDDSILATIKKMLGYNEEYAPFDTDIIVFINSALMKLHQLGVGPKEGFVIKGYTEQWSEFLSANKVIMTAVQEYVYMQVKMVFDPPSNSFVMTAMQERCKEYETRLNVQAESVESFWFVNPDGNPHM